VLWGCFTPPTGWRYEQFGGEPSEGVHEQFFLFLLFFLRHGLWTWSSVSLRHGILSTATSHAHSCTTCGSVGVAEPEAKRQ